MMRKKIHSTKMFQQAPIKKQYTKNQNEGAQCMLINFLFAT